MARLAPRVIGRYTLYQPIGSGGMATVYLGRMTGAGGFSKLIAVKRLHDDAVSGDGLAKLVDEARLTAHVQHPNVVSVIDALAEASEMFLVMEYVRGVSLAALLHSLRKTDARIPPAIASNMVLGALHGLHAAHEARDEAGHPLDIVHRDISPQNLMVGPDGVTKLLDFGVAKAAWRLQHTEEGQLKGKVAYMAPEQLRSEPCDRRVDIHAMGTVLWELLVGRRLWLGENPASTMAAIAMEEAPRPSSSRAELSPAVDDVVRRALAKDPQERYPTAREFAQDLEAALAPASQLSVGEWVSRVAAELLQQQDVQLELISESASLPTVSLEPSRRNSGVIAAQQDGSNNAMVRAPVSLRPLGLKRSVTLGVLLALGAFGIVLGVVLLGARRASQPDVPLSVGAPMSSTPIENGLEAGSTSGDASGGSASASVEPSAAGPRQRPPARRASPVKRPGASCNPPYHVDERGIKRYLPECF